MECKRDEEARHADGEKEKAEPSIRSGCIQDKIAMRGSLNVLSGWKGMCFHCTRTFSFSYRGIPRCLLIAHHT